MSVAFTDVADWTNAGQGLIGVNELVLAYSERRQVLGNAAVDALTAGVSGQDKTLWLEMQEWCEANCTSFIDHVNGPLNPGGTAFIYFTLATWRAAAGLHTDGFRRRVEPNDADSYGVIQVGDTRGDWCFEDLQKGFSALRWMNKAGSVNSVQMRSGRSYAAFLADSWTDDPWEGAVMYRCNFRTIPSYSLSRLRGKAAISDISTIIPHTAHIYFHPQHYVYSTTIPYADLDNYGMAEDEYWLFQDFASSSDASHISNFLGDIETEPVDAPPERHDIDCTIAGWLLKWDFTNQNA